MSNGFKNKCVQIEYCLILRYSQLKKDNGLCLKHLITKKELQTYQKSVL